MAKLHVLRVFCAEDGLHGNPLGVFADGSEVAPEQRQAVARDLGFSETVFVDDADDGVIRIFTPEVELPFAGHPSVGTAWLLRERGHDFGSLRPPAGELRVREEAGRTWIAAKPEWAPQFEYIQLASPGEVDALAEAPDSSGWTYCWAWEDEAAGLVRARSFVAEAGIAEDEATGAAALVLCSRLGRAIRVRQGRGSEILAWRRDAGFVEIGGRVALDEVRDYSIESR
jgi:predicted PhzF superfamily epimerase YddE/YHI9